MPVVDFFDAFPNFRGFMDLLPKDLRADQITLDDIDWDEPDAVAVDAALTKLIAHEFTVRPAPGVIEEVHNAFNVPIISMINDAAPSLTPGSRVLIIGADVGQDVRRLKRATTTQIIVDAVEPNPDAVEYLREELRLFGGGNLYVGKFHDAFPPDKAPTHQYDLIIHNMGLHVVCGTAESRVHYADTIQRLLRPGTGRLIGTSIDPHGACVSDLAGNKAISKTVDVVSLYDPQPNADLGIVQMRVCDKQFRDPVLPLDVIEDMFFDKPNLQCQVIPARYALRQNANNPVVWRYRAPEKMERFARRPELQVVACVDVRACAAEPPPDLVPIPGYCDHWRRKYEYASHELAYMGFPLNHGRALTADDLLYMGPGAIAVAYKRNGIEGRMVLRRGAIDLKLGDGRFFQIGALPFDFDHTWQLQVEVVAKGDRINRVYVTDVYRTGLRTPTSFKARWQRLTELYHRNPMLAQFFEPNYFCMVPHPRTLEDMFKRQPDDTDGWVVMPLHAPPGKPGENFGSARYLKRVVTVDTLAGDGIVWETDLKGMPLKVRLDRKDGNTDLQVAHLLRALTPEEYLAYYEHTQGQRLQIQQLPHLVDLLSGRMLLEDLPDDELVHWVLGRQNDVDVQEFLLDHSGEIIHAKYRQLRNKALEHAHYRVAKWGQMDFGINRAEAVAAIAVLRAKLPARSQQVEVLDDAEFF